VDAVSEEGILDGCTDIDHHSWAKVDEALVGSDRYVNSKVKRLIEGSKSAERTCISCETSREAIFWGSNRV